MKKTLTAITCLFSLLFTNCSDSFLDISNPARLSPAVFPGNMEDMESIVTAIYGQMTQVGLYGKRIMAKGTIVTDHTVDMSWKADFAWNQLATNQITPDNAYISTLWFGLYKVVNCANIVLQEIERMDRGSLTQDDLSRLSQMRGEALFWRGWAHQQLVALYGEGFPANGDGGKQGIPIRLAVASTPDMLNISRSTVSEVYEQVLADYREAETLLPAAWADAADRPRPTSFAAKSYIGQVYLYTGDHAAAKTALKDIIDNSGKSLVPFGDYERMFNQTQTKFNNESILEINFKNGSSADYFWNSEGSQYALVAALCFRGPDGSVQSAGWGNIFLHDANIDRFGDDPRLHIAALEPGTPVVMRDQQTVVMKYKDIDDSYRGWSLRKYIPTDAVVGQAPYTGNSVGINMYLMRLADVFLMYAEASLTSDQADAREYINKVRRRAYNLPVDAASAVDLVSGGDQLRDDLREERFREFCGEGIQHWIDVCRWKTLDREIQSWYSRTTVGATHYDSHDLYYPIPISELENNPNMTQSTGY